MLKFVLFLVVGAGRVFICCCVLCLFGMVCWFVCLSVSGVCVWERPNHNESTASRLLSKVKHCRAWLVLRWGTTLESWVLFSSSFILLEVTHPTHQFFAQDLTGFITVNSVQIERCVGKYSSRAFISHFLVPLTPKIEEVRAS